MDLTEQDCWTVIASLGWTAETWRKRLATEADNPPSLSALMVANAERAEELRDRLLADDDGPDEYEFAERGLRGG